MNVLEIRQLDKCFVSHKKGTLVHAVDHVNLTLAKGEFLGIVGESGCGKSTIAKLVMGLLTPDGGEILLDGEALHCPYSRGVYKRLQMIFQMPKDSFDPRRTIGKCLTGVLKNFGTPAEQCREKAVALENARKLDGVQVIIRARAGGAGKLFGAVTSQEISDALKEQFDIDIEKNKIVQAEPIKSFGSYTVKAKLGFETSGNINVLVVEA